MVLAFFLLVGRLYQLQIVQGPTFRSQADANRFRFVELPAPRGVIYDRNGAILARNQPSFAISVVPADLPADDIETDVNERTQAIEELLRILHADTDTDVALGVASTMFRRLGRADFTRAAESVGVKLTFTTVLVPVYSAQEEGGEVPEVQTVIPDLSVPLPLNGLAAVVQRAVELGSLGSSFEPITILDLVKRGDAFRVAEEIYKLPGVQVVQEPVRQYPYGQQVSHVLGFMGPIPALAAQDYAARGYTNPNEQVGLNGVEYTYQDELRGQPGSKFIEVDIVGREMRTVGKVIEPQPGLNLRLTVDMRLQQIMYDALSKAADEANAPNAVTIAMNPQTGEILGMVSLPSFDNNIFSEGIGEDYVALEQDERRPLINYAIGGLYPPGSTFKMVSATAGLAEGIISPSTVIEDNGPLYLPNRFFPDDPSQAQKFVSWNHKLGINHGRLRVRDALALSNDIFFYWVGGGYPDVFEGLGDERLAKWAELFGFGSPVGIDLPGEVAFPVPDDQWKRINLAESWVTGDSYNMAIGQGYLLGTPLQVLVSTAAVANGGKVMRPQIVRQIVDAEGGLQRDLTPEVIRQLPIDPGLLEYVRLGMWDAVNQDYGTAPNARVAGVDVAGKTGTAEFCEWIPEEQDCRRDREGNLPFHAWFTAFAPYDNPEIAIVVFVYDGGEGSTIAAPVAQEVLQAYFTDIKPLIAQTQ
jgi:penicillin-binding protein 2